MSSQGFLEKIFKKKGIRPIFYVTNISNFMLWDDKGPYIFTWQFFCIFSQEVIIKL